ncbi:MAG: hypothetical protein AOY29_06175 [Alcanivorax borkumensis]|uniref:Outer membrane lipoprotein Blc n=2 Tax=Alcanivorax TaxID=59753 RepID=Q0VR81_ALCBS|nr:lipocalin family protein [Alcanivorax borkumensis]OJH06751.1 MAG: hypothetical protein AOY29_06175 [Alcanivorax borkumensis]CAL16317.1 outer membrane lipoprotein Blc, putative [Alcanivorax borkumensis SK2]
MFMPHPVRTTRLLAILLVSGLLCACGGDKPLATVGQVDLQRYTGTWYEIARLPQWFQRGCYDSTATYSANDDGTLKIVNRCQREGDESREAVGTARVVPNTGNAKLKVRFDNWVSKLIPTITEGNYWIIALDKDYQTVVIGEPSRKYLWILARQPELGDDQYQALLQLAKTKGFPVDQLERNRDLRPSKQ